MRRRVRSLVLLAVVLLLAACGGDPEEGQGAERQQATSPCAEAFESAVPAEDDPTIPSNDDDRETPTTDDELDAVTLERLQPTLEACEDVEDWLAGAREHREAIPRELDGVAALRFLCETMESDTTPCEEVAVPDDIDDAGGDVTGSPSP